MLPITYGSNAPQMVDDAMLLDKFLPKTIGALCFSLSGFADLWAFGVLFSSS